MDHGKQEFICQICNAKLWPDEAVRGKRYANKIGYSLCCGYGKVELPKYKEPPPNYKRLFDGGNTKSNYFLKYIRRWNSMYSFTSMGGKVDNSVNKGSGPSVFRLSGQNYHRIGSLIPSDDSQPKFSQLYIYDTDNEITNRQRAIRYF